MAPKCNRKQTRSTAAAAAFSLIELVIVVVIIAIIAAIAIPRMSRGAAGAADSALSGNLRVLRSAVDLYATEHNGSFPPLANLAIALTQYSNEQGTDFGTKSVASGRIFGPYLRDIPPLPVGANKGSKTFTATAPGAAATAGFGWYYDETTGTVRANCADAEKDARDVKYNDY